MQPNLYSFNITNIDFETRGHLYLLCSNYTNGGYILHYQFDYFDEDKCLQRYSFILPYQLSHAQAANLLSFVIYNHLKN